jgi:thioredoxin-related protein
MGMIYDNNDLFSRKRINSKTSQPMFAGIISTGCIYFSHLKRAFKLKRSKIYPFSTKKTLKNYLKNNFPAHIAIINN